MESPNVTGVLGLKRKFPSPDSLREHKTSFGYPSVFNDKYSCMHKVPSLVESCFNYLNSGVPYRVMFYNHGDWHDFPDSVTKILADGFKNEKSSSRFSIGEEPLLLDFLSMTVINLRTRKQRSIAWIDEHQKCFFPSIFSHSKDSTSEWDFENLINKSVQTEVARVDISPSEVTKHVVPETAATNPERPPSTVSTLRRTLDPLAKGTESFLSVQKQFLSGMGPFARPDNIRCIHQHVPKDSKGQKRKETFERLIKLTEEEHGNANVKYAWFGASKLETVGVLVHGFGCFGRPTEGVLGTGLYLMPEGRAFASVNHCDVDEKGMQYLILCRVILGNMEQVHPGSKQYFPSSGDYDSGVDDLSDPKCYVVWPSHLSTYINPEYFVSFKLEPHVQEYLSDLKDIRYHLVTIPASDYSALHHVTSEQVKPPTSPWVPFAVLFEAVRAHVPPLAMELLLYHHEELKNKVISREELVKKIRVLIGDQLLIYVLNKFKRDPSSWYEDPPTKRTKLEEPTTPQSERKEDDVMNHLIDGSIWPPSEPTGAMEP